MTNCQLTFQLPADPTYTQDSFFVSDANRDAFSWVTQWPQWSSHGLILVGPPGSGKTHLAHIWQNLAKAKFISALTTETCLQLSTNVIFDEVELDEKAFFHCYNFLRENNLSFLITTKVPPQQWNIALPDLKSRLVSLPKVEIFQPDEELLRAIILKRFSDYQVTISDKITHYILTRAERSCEAIHRLIETVNTFSLSARRPISFQLVQEALHNIQPKIESGPLDS